MSQILVRDVEPEVVNRLKQRAKYNGRSLEAEVRTILGQEARKQSWQEAREDIMQIRKLFEGRHFPDSSELIREDRDR